MSDEGAGGALAAAVTGALTGVSGLSQISDGPPIQAADAAAMVEMGPEADWGHKSGAGAEIRFAVSLRCGGERPGRARRMMADAAAALAAMSRDLDGWHLVSLAPIRSRMLRESGPGWRGVMDYRARMLAAPP